MLSEKTCNNCQWFVEETSTIGDYQHDEAVKRGSGFCLMLDFISEVTPDTPACEEYTQAKDDIKRYKSVLHTK